jgi:putative transposase
MCRGNHRNDIFRDEEDYQIYLILISQAIERYGFVLYAYCLMTNHVHLQFETGNSEIWFIMKYINMLYTQYFNEKYKLVGHLFQGRYAAEIISDDAYILQTSRYIHLNPVKARMAVTPSDYKWSSYRVFLGICSSTMVTEQKILRYFEQESRALYQAFVEGSTRFNAIDQEMEDKMEDT